MYTHCFYFLFSFLLPTKNHFFFFLATCSTELHRQREKTRTNPINKNKQAKTRTQDERYFHKPRQSKTNRTALTQPSYHITTIWSMRFPFAIYLFDDSFLRKNNPINLMDGRYHKHIHI